MPSRPERILILRLHAGHDTTTSYFLPACTLSQATTTARSVMLRTVKPVLLASIRSGFSDSQEFKFSHLRRWVQSALVRQHGHKEQHGHGIMEEYKNRQRRTWEKTKKRHPRTLTKPRLCDSHERQRDFATRPERSTLRTPPHTPPRLHPRALSLVC